MQTMLPTMDIAYPYTSLHLQIKSHPFTPTYSTTVLHLSVDGLLGDNSTMLTHLISCILFTNWAAQYCQPFIEGGLDIELRGTTGSTRPPLPLPPHTSPHKLGRIQLGIQHCYPYHYLPIQ